MPLDYNTSKGVYQINYFNFNFNFILTLSITLTLTLSYISCIVHSSFATKSILFSNNSGIMYELDKQEVGHLDIGVLDKQDLEAGGLGPQGSNDYMTK